MKQIFSLTALLVFLLCSPSLEAVGMQRGLKIQDVFQRYGKKKNVTMVEMSKEMLDSYHMSHYRSITIKQDEKALRFVRECLQADQKDARTIKEVVSDGQVTSAYYELPGQRDKQNRFILFKVNNKGVITLVYIEGELQSDDLISLLFD